MRFRLIMQIAADGDKRLSLVSDPTVQIEDCLVEAGKWSKAKTLVESVDITGSDDILCEINNHEFASVRNNDEGDDAVVPKSAQPMLATMIAAHLAREVEEGQDA